MTQIRTATDRTITVSVLMSIYNKVKPAQLAACLDSLTKQTRLPDQFVIVQDGPLTKKLMVLIAIFSANLPGRVETIPLEKNQGLPDALNTGLTHCKADWILRMDADDVALPNRIEAQTDFLLCHPEVDVLGSSMLEFLEDPSQPERKKSVVKTHEAIKAQMPYRNPINHPTVCCRKSLLNDLSGYPAMPFLEDYFLWAKLMHAGAIFHNMEEPLHLYRFDQQTLLRRAGKANFVNECRLRWWMFRHGMMNSIALVIVISLQIILRFAPLKIRMWLWRISRDGIERK